jgi:hypothetical protein
MYYLGVFLHNLLRLKREITETLTNEHIAAANLCQSIFEIGK